MKQSNASFSPTENQKDQTPVSGSINRRSFLRTVGVGAAALELHQTAQSAEKANDKPIAGFEAAPNSAEAHEGWKPVSDRKLRMGIVGYGVCKFGAVWGFQNHQNVEVVAVSDLIPERCAGLAKAVRCEKTYPSLEELVKDDKIEAVFVATDAPNHAKHCMEVLTHGKHVGTAPASKKP